MAGCPRFRASLFICAHRSASLGGGGDPLATHRCKLRVGPRAALVELRQSTLRIHMRDVTRGSRVLLRTGPAVCGDVEDDAVEVGVLHLVAVRIVRIAHDPGRADVARDLALLDHVIDPEADVVDADKVHAGALRSLVALEVEDGEVDHAVSQEHALGQRAVELRDFLQAHSLLVEFGGLPRVLDAEGDVTDAAFGLRGHGLAPFHQPWAEECNGNPADDIACPRKGEVAAPTAAIGRALSAARSRRPRSRRRAAPSPNAGRRRARGPGRPWSRRRAGKGSTRSGRPRRRREPGRRSRAPARRRLLRRPRTPHRTSRPRSREWAATRRGRAGQRSRRGSRSAPWRWRAAPGWWRSADLQRGAPRRSPSGSSSADGARCAAPSGTIDRRDSYSDWPARWAPGFSAAGGRRARRTVGSARSSRSPTGRSAVARSARRRPAPFSRDGRAPSRWRHRGRSRWDGRPCPAWSGTAPSRGWPAPYPSGRCGPSRRSRRSLSGSPPRLPRHRP